MQTTTLTRINLGALKRTLRLIYEHHRALRKCPQQLFVHRHQLRVELHRERDEFTVVRRAIAVSNKFQHGVRIDFALRSGEQAFSFGLQAVGLLEGYGFAS